MNEKRLIRIQRSRDGGITWEDSEEPIYKDHTPEKNSSALTYSPDELASKLSVGRQAVYKGLRNGEIPSIRLGKLFVIPRSAIAEWLRTAGGKLKDKCGPP